MMPRSGRLCLLLAALLVVAVPRAAAAEDFFFKDGDTVVMIGDSITEQHLYTSYVELWTITRFPSWKLVFRNVGIAADRSPGGNKRFQRDVVSLKPTALTVDFGMNDGYYRAFDPATFNTYMAGLQGMADQAKAARLRVAWLTPSPVEKDEDGPALQGYNETLEKFSAGVQEIAVRNRGVFVDQFHPFVAAQDRARAADPKNRIADSDVIHPGPPGQALMAGAILKGFHFPALVSSVEIDAARGTVARTRRCTVTGLEARGDRIRFDRLDEALPYFPDEARSILKWVPIHRELNVYGLRVTGLKTGRYEVRLGGKKVAEHSSDALAAGVNLAEAALTDGPVAEQVKAIGEAVKAKNSYFHTRIFHGVMLANVPLPGSLDVRLTPAEIQARRQAAVAELSNKMSEYDAAIRTALLIKPHQVEVVAAGK
jgi:lysophospholipase L1-like esterase